MSSYRIKEKAIMVEDEMLFDAARRMHKRGWNLQFIQDDLVQMGVVETALMDIITADNPDPRNVISACKTLADIKGLGRQSKEKTLAGAVLKLQKALKEQKTIEGELSDQEELTTERTGNPFKDTQH